MIRVLTAAVMFSSALALLLPTNGMAQESALPDLKREVDALRKEVEALKSREQQAPAGRTTGSEGQQEEETVGAREGYLTPFATQPQLIEKELRRISAFRFSGYFRAGAGVSLEGGGNQACFRAPGSAAKYRLGNECEDYAELVFAYDVYRPQAEGPYFRANTRLAFDGGWLHRFQDVQLFAPELYVEAANLFGGGRLRSAKFWAGKRYYRQEQVLLNDFYFWDLSGPGAGVEAIDAGIGKLAVAYVRNAGVESGKFTVQAISSAGTPTLVSVPAAPQLENNQAVSSGQVDWSELPVNPGGTLNLGVQGRDLNGPEQGARGTRGWALFGMHTQKVGGGFNQAILQYGRGLAASLAPAADLLAENAAHTVRIIDWLVLQPSGQYSAGLVAIYQRASGVQTHPEHWVSLGARPIYNFTEHFRVAVEVGADLVEPANAERRRLTKVTLAPEIAKGRKFHDRPVLRFYMTYARWNDAAAENGVVLTDAVLPPFVDKRSGVAIGVQAETWW
jgi:maltoporin